MPFSPGPVPRMTLPSARRGAGPGGGGAGFAVGGAGIAGGCVGVLTASCAYDGTPISSTITISTIFTPTSLPQSVHEQRAAGGDGHVLAAADRIRHRPGRDLSAHTSPPQLFARPGVEREEVSF